MIHKWLGGAAELLLTGALLAGFRPGIAAEPEVAAKDLPRVPATEPANATKTFTVKKGFRIELAAAEPLVMSPVAMAFDENGRLFVVEMRDYSERRDERLGRVRMLEDTNGDGVFDKSTVYAENLPWPTAVICYGGGVFVGSTPDIIYFKDTDGDGVADEKKVVFTGFGTAVEKLNVQQLMNSFNWGLDNRIHGATAGNGGVITAPGRSDFAPLDLRGLDFSFDPRALDMRAETGGGQHGFGFDNGGRKFVCSNSSHIRQVMFDHRYPARQSGFSAPSGTIDIAVDGPAAEVYRLSPDEPWRVLRTKWRVSGVVPGMIEGGGRPSGYFTGATGSIIYRGDAFSPDYLENVFVADCGSNLIHRKKLTPDGVALKAERPADEQKTEFAASTDNWFRPVQFANAPDGTLYVIDMYREVIEHPWSLPANIKKHLDLNSGNDRGRIYRIVPDGFRQPKLPALGKAGTAELVALLEHPNGWHRDTAARLLWERRDLSAVPALRRLASESKRPVGRVHALRALAGLAKLDLGLVVRAYSDPDPVVRVHALRLTEEFAPAEANVALTKAEALAEDPDPRVVYQLALTLGYTGFSGAERILVRAVSGHLADPWIRTAVLMSSSSQPLRLLEAMLVVASFRDSAAGQEFMGQLCLNAGARAGREELSQVIVAGRVLGGKELAVTLAARLGEGLSRSGKRLELTADQHAAILLDAEDLAKDRKASVASRVAAARTLGQGNAAEAARTLVALLELGEPEALQTAALKTVASFPGPEFPKMLFGKWDQLTPRLRSELVEASLRRPEGARALLDGLKEGSIQKAELSAAQSQALRGHADAEVKRRSAELLGTPPASRQAVLAEYKPALALRGDAAHGKTIYTERCATCHRFKGQGFALGPDLESVHSAGAETFLTNLLDPNREVAPKYLNYQVQTKSGESLGGVIVSESASGLTLRRANNEESVVARENIVSLKSLGQSLMPEGLESGLKPQDLADLIDYILK